MLDELRPLWSRTRARRSWTEDPHLRRGFLLALPLFFILTPLVLGFGASPWLRRRDPVPFLLAGLPLSLLLNAAWLALAARARENRR